jgi:hypothetical protein
VPFCCEPLQLPATTWFEPISDGNARQSLALADTHTPVALDHDPVVHVTPMSPLAE